MHSQRYGHVNICIKQRNTLINGKHPICVFLISFVLLTVWILAANVQAYASSDILNNGNAVQDEFTQMGEETVLSRNITPQMFGAIGDGKTDDTEAFTELTVYCNANPGTAVFIPAGHYIIQKPLAFTKSVTIHGSGQDTLLDFSRIKDSREAAVLITGSFREVGILTGPHEKGRNEIFCENAFMLKTGDIVAVLDPNDYSWSKERAGYRKGEFCEVFAGGSMSVEVVHNLNDDYDIGCEVFLMDMIQCEVSDLQIRVYDRGDIVGMTPLKLYCVKHSLVRDVTASGSNYGQISVRSSYDVLLDHVRADYICTSSEGTHYGLLVTNSQFVHVTNSTINARRHGVTIGGTQETISIVNRFVTISDSTITGRETAGADIHGNSQFVRYERCSIFNGLTFAGSDLTVDSCEIHCDQRVLWFSSQYLVNGNLNITNNSFYMDTAKSKDFSEYPFIIKLRPQAYQFEDCMVRIENNVFEQCSDKALLISADECQNKCTLVLRGNDFRGGDITVENVQTVMIDSNTMRASCKIRDARIAQNSAMETISFTNNTFYNLIGNGIQISNPNQNSAIVNISRNSFSKVSGTAIFVEESENLLLTMNDNSFQACGKDTASY